MHGTAEQKVAGGKLVRADVAYDDTIEAVTLHGDFFVYPEEALDMLEAALTGSDRDADAATLADRVRDAAADAQLLGFDADDIAAVVREAMTDD